MTGRLIAVVGPSGVGKDSVIAGICAARPDIGPVRRVITRAPEPGAEDHATVTEAAFDAALARGAFCLHWRAHGLRYGIPTEVLAEVRGGAWRIANLSRGVLPEAAALCPALTVLHVTAAPGVLAARLAARGRETKAEIAGRLHRAGQALPPGIEAVELRNDGPLRETVARALRALQPASAAP